MPASLRILVIDETSRTSVLELDFLDEIDDYVSFLNIESTADCELSIRFKGMDYVKYPKGLQADVPLIVEAGEAVIYSIKIKPSASTDIMGWAVASGVRVIRARSGGP